MIIKYLLKLTDHTVQTCFALKCNKCVRPFCYNGINLGVPAWSGNIKLKLTGLFTCVSKPEALQL